MIFKWTSKNKVAAEVAPEAPAQPAAAETAAPQKVEEPAASSASAGAGQMARDLFEKVVPFKSRSSSGDGENGDDARAQTFLHEGGLGQEQAIESLRFGAAIKGHDYNIIVSAPRGVDAAALVRAVLKSGLKKDGVSDWVYVPCLAGTETWLALSLPPTRGLSFKRLLARALGDLCEALPDVFVSETYQLRRLAIDEMHGRESDGALIDLIHRAAAKNVAVLRLPQGFSVAPMHDGKIVRPEVLAQLPETMRREVETRVRGYQAELEALLKRVPHLDRARRSELRELHEDIVAKAAALAFSDVREAFADVPQALARLDAIEKDLKAHATRVVAATDSASDIWRRYDVAVIRSGEGAAAPIIELHDVRPEALVGRIHGEIPGSVPQGGALHQAQGGAIVLSADAMLHEPDAREVLVRTLLAREIALGGDSTAADAIPFDAKVVLIGLPETCERLFNVDHRLKGLFKLRADLKAEMARTKETESHFADAVQGLVTRHKTKPIEASVVPLLVADASRAAGDDGLMSVALGDTADLLREASTWAELAGDGTIEARHIERALKAREERGSGAGGRPPLAAQSAGKVAKALGS